MKTKRVNRYYCDFCKKSGGSSYHMKNHEKYCTMNPDRECRMCKFVDGSQLPMAELLALLPGIEKYEQVDEYGNDYYSATLRPAMIEPLKMLREATDDCPVCILATLRQRGIPFEFYCDEFDYSKEFADVMKLHNDEEKAMREEESAFEPADAASWEY